jgi:hypothetical protein
MTTTLDPILRTVTNARNELDNAEAAGVDSGANSAYCSFGVMATVWDVTGLGLIGFGFDVGGSGMSVDVYLYACT